MTVATHASNKGHIATYNEGIDWVSADYFSLLSADDYLLPGALSRATRLMGTNQGVGFVFGNAIELAPNGEREFVTPLASLAMGEKECRVFSGREFVTLSGSRNIVPTPTPVIRTWLQKKLGGYRPELPHSGDMEMWWRFAGHSDIGFVNAEQAVYRRHASNMSHAYEASSRLPDILQRKSALEFVFAAHDVALWKDAVVRRKFGINWLGKPFHARAMHSTGQNTTPQTSYSPSR